jgi:transcriptional regulator with XRE-family HTH domain
MASRLRTATIRVDASDRWSKNDAMTKEQRAHFAEMLRTGRAKLALNKVKFCQQAKIAPNTLRALERGVQDPGQGTLDKLSAVLGITVAALTGGERPIETTDPRLKDLNDEDLEVAQAFHHAPMRGRQRVLGVLQERPRHHKESLNRDASEWSRRLLALDPEKRQAVATLIGEFESARAREEDQPAATALDEPTLAIARRFQALELQHQQSLLALIVEYETPRKKEHAARRNRAPISPDRARPIRKVR